MASWASRIPAVQQQLNLSEGTLGLALLGMASGALPAMLVTSRLIARFGSPTVTRFAGFALCLSVLLPALSFSCLSLFAALLLLGAASGVLNVSQNAQAAHIEKLWGRPIMASFHALFSIGCLTGAVLGAGAARAELAPLPHLGLIGCLLCVLVVVAARYLLPATKREATENMPRPRFSLGGHGSLAPLVSLCVISFCTVFSEGAVADWSAVYLKRGLGASPGLAVIGYAAFALMMVVGRTTGDRLGHLWGDKKLVRLSAILATVGFGTALLIGGIVPAIFGCACMGLGCASVYPIMVRASARLSGFAPGTAIAATGTVGYLGFFIGPPLIGLVAVHITLRWALLLVVAASAAIIFLAPAVAPKTDKSHEEVLA